MDSSINNYNIIVLGPSGSGKTVFLASMFKKLSTQGQDTTFSIVASAAQRKILTEKYFELATSDEWPAGTLYNEVSEWQFTCMVRPPKGSNYEALQFTYLDFAGGRIDNLQGDDLEESKFQERLTNAHALLGILDGRKILALMQGDSGIDTKRFLFRELPNELAIMGQCNNPIHFIITKWDILQGRYTLAQIRDRLLQIESFKNLVYSRIQNCRVRLIPVSSVGTGFATLQKDGTMKKTGKEPQPLRVEDPLCCVLPDIFTAELSRRANMENILAQSITPTRPNLTFWDKIGLAAGNVIRSVRGYLKGAYGLDELMLGQLLRYVESSARNKREEFIKEQQRLLTEQKASLAAVQDQQSAMKHALNSFLYITTKLDIEFPDSDLSRLR